MHAAQDSEAKIPPAVRATRNKQLTDLLEGNQPSTKRKATKPVECPGTPESYESSDTHHLDYGEMDNPWYEDPFVLENSGVSESVDKRHKLSIVDQIIEEDLQETKEDE